MSDSAEKPGGKSTPVPWVILSGFLGIFAIGTPVVTNSTKTKEPEKKETVVNETAAFRMSGKDPLKPVYDFYATHDGRWDPEDDLRRNLHNYEVEFLIATVPDPIDTPYGHAFDQVVDAVQRAIEKKDGYLLDRSWLPWELDRKPKSKADEEANAGNLRESFPGILLFRHAKHAERKIKKPGLCIVFLVGETPMGGLHKRAFTRALRMMAAAGHPESDPVRVVGPYFTGSQTSVQFVVSDWWASADSWPRINKLYPFDVVIRPQNPVYQFDFITGSASAIRRGDFFDLNPYVDGHPSWQRDKFSMTATVVPTRTILSAMLRYLSRRDGCKSNEPIKRGLSHIPGKIALLTEGNTGFGKSAANFDKQDVLTLRFPLHISRVKNEYTQAFRKKDEQDGLKQMDLLVPSRFEDANQANEGVPSQGGATTATVNAQVLSNILATIAREQCRYVGVVASDSRDKLFLIRLIREHCPDVRIFVTDADQLLLHPDYRYYMRGVVIGSTYSLIPENQTWVNPAGRERILFATVGAQGCYNATLMHMGMNKELLEYAPPAFVQRDPNESPKGLQRPPIWISAVSPNGTFVPLQVFTDYDDPSGYVRLNSEAKVDEPEKATLSYPGAMLPIGFILFAVWGFLVYQALFVRSSRMFWEPATATGEFSLPQLCYRNLLLGSQAVLTFPVLAVVLTHGQANHFRADWMVGLVILMVVLSAGFMVGMIKPLCWPPSRIRQFAQWLKPQRLEGGRLELWTWAAVNVLLVAIVAGFAALFLSRFWIYGGDTRRTLFFFRAVDLTSGLSPLTPLMFMSIGFAAWAYFQLKRAHQIDRYAVPPPFPAGVGDGAADGTFARITDLDRALQEEVRHESLALRHSKAIVITTLGLLALGLAVWVQSLPTVEGWSWDGTFFTGFWLLFALNVSILVRLFFLWRKTKQLLNAVSLVPMMRAFGRLPAKVADVFGKYLFTQIPRLEHLQLPIHQLQLLAAETSKSSDAPAELAEIGRVADALDRRLQEGLDQNVSRATALRAERDLRGKFSAVAATCLGALAPRWRSLPVEEAYGEWTAKMRDDKAKAGDANEPSWVPLAENVVAAQIIIYVSQFFAQLRSLVVAAMVCTSLLLLSATSYSFHPERLLLICLLGLSAAGIGAVVWVLVEMNRDEVVSRILKTTPGKFSLDSGFVGSFVTYVVPAMGILIAQMSGSFRWLLEPILHVMK